MNVSSISFNTNTKTLLYFNCNLSKIKHFRDIMSKRKQSCCDNNPKANKTKAGKTVVSKSFTKTEFHERHPVRKASEIRPELECIIPKIHVPVSRWGSKALGLLMSVLGSMHSLQIDDGVSLHFFSHFAYLYVLGCWSLESNV